MFLVASVAIVCCTRGGYLSNMNGLEIVVNTVCNGCVRIPGENTATLSNGEPICEPGCTSTPP
jgi:hypothetical protein